MLPLQEGWPLGQNYLQKTSGSTGKMTKPFYAKKMSDTEEGLGSAEFKQVDPLDLLYSSSEEETDLRLVRVDDGGSQIHCAKVQVQGVPAYGIIDSGADTTIIGGSLLRKVATVACLINNTKNSRRQTRCHGAMI